MEYCSEDPNCTNPWCSCDKMSDGSLRNQNIQFILKGSADRTELVERLKVDRCTVHPCQHRSPPAIGGESYYKEKLELLVREILIDDNCDHLDDAKRFIEEYIL